MSLLNGINQLLLFLFLVMGVVALSWHLFDKIIGIFRKRGIKKNENSNRQNLQSQFSQMPSMTQAQMPAQIPYYQQQQMPMPSPQPMYDPNIQQPPQQLYYYEQNGPQAYDEQPQPGRKNMRVFHTTQEQNDDSGEYDEPKKTNNYSDFVSKNFK